MRFVVLSLVLLSAPNIGAMEVNTKLSMYKEDYTGKTVVPYKKPETIKLEPLDKRLHAHADWIIIGGIIIYGLHTILTEDAYPPYSYFDR